MTKPFTGFSRQALAFFRDLEKNNDRAWFTPRKAFFEAEVRGPMIELVERLSSAIARIDPAYVPERPEKIIYRIYRDTRFSKDKTPYKTHLGALFQHRRIEKNRGAGLYFEVSHRHLGIAGGIYMPSPEDLLVLRRHIEQHAPELTAICKPLEKRFGPLQGDSAARVPKPFPPDAKAGDLLKRKQIYFYQELDAKIALSPRLSIEIITRFKKLFPLIHYLNAPLLDALGTDTIPKRPEPMF